MPAKAPIYLKTAGGKNTAGAKGSKKLRELLSTDMISPPLGDFRHMAHVGRGGSDDMFGDTSFLQKGNNALSGNNSTRKSDSNLTNGSGFRRGGSLGKKEKGSKKGRTISLSHDQSSTLDRFKRKKRSAKTSVNNEGERDSEMSPVLQSAFSLPILSNDSTSPTHTTESLDKTSNGSSAQGSNNNTIDKQIRSKSHEEGIHTFLPQEGVASTQKTPNGNTGGPPKPRRILSVRGETPVKAVDPAEPTELGAIDKLSPLRRSPEVLSDMPDIVRNKIGTPDQEEDGWSFNLDLGPSLMDEIMGVMSQSKIAS